MLGRHRDQSHEKMLCSLFEDRKTLDKRRVEIASDLVDDGPYVKSFTSESSLVACSHTTTNISSLFLTPPFFPLRYPICSILDRTTASPQTLEHTHARLHTYVHTYMHTSVNPST